MNGTVYNNIDLKHVYITLYNHAISWHLPQRPCRHGSHEVHWPWSHLVTEQFYDRSRPLDLYFLQFSAVWSHQWQSLCSVWQYITKCLPKTMIEKIISVRSRILEFFFTSFWEALSNLWRLFLAHFLVESNGILSQLSEMVQHLYLGWKNKGSRVPNIFNPFSIKICFFESLGDVFHPT